MKLFFATAAALAAAIAAPAAAAPAPVPAAPVLAAAPLALAQDRVVIRERTTVSRRHWQRPRYRWRTVCRTTYRNGDRRRVCRRVRYRY